MAQVTGAAERPSSSRHHGETLQISLLGPLIVSRNGEPLNVSGPKRRALLTLLALHIGTPVGREQIVESLWPRRQTGREESTLRVHVSHLRDQLEPDRHGDPTVLVTHGASYMLDPGAVDLDIGRFDHLTREARDLLAEEPGRARQLLDEALGMWRGRPLQDVEYEEFAQDETRRLERARIDAVEDRAQALVELGEPVAALEDLEGLVRTDPTRERAVTLLMTALYRAGRQADALRAARRHVRVLAETGLEPSPQLGVLEEKILRHDPELLPAGMVSPDDLVPGRSVRGYELRDVAGSGSIGVVYRAFQPAVGREVAVKVVHPELAQTPDFVRRFAEEARVIASLEHPHIVPLHDFWREPAGAFLVMRWMDGGDLGARIGNRWDEAEIVRVFDQLADALGYAHSAGVVHRDVKPGNVLFDGAGNAYLCDFGLAAAGIDTGRERPATIEPPYASPELMGGEGPTVASDMYGLGVLLAEAASGAEFGARSTLEGDVREVVQVATAENPADRYPDMTSFRLALREAVETTTAPAPRRVRRNPYKGLAPFDEGDSADFYGRDDLVESVVDVVGRNGLTAIIGASGSGKSSVVMAGVVPAIRGGALRGSEEWSFVYMVPGIDPFEEFHIGLRQAAVGYPSAGSGDSTRELRRSFTEALDGPKRCALLVVDQFEELFSSAVDPEVRERFLENLVDLASDNAGRFRVLLTMRADFSDRPLSHPSFGEMVSTASILLAPMRPDQIEDVIRRPAARVGVQVEPGLISEIVRDVSDAPAYLPLLQYVLSELFERRSEDRLTVHAYRSLGGVQGVLERQAEATFSSLDAGARSAGRQLFLRMVQLGEHGEETRRRVPLTELSGLGLRADVDVALEAFSAARLITYDRDPVSRTPTVEVAHETVISRWTRYRVWIDEARADLLAHRRLSAAADSWAESDEDPSYLLTGGPLAAAQDLVSGDRVALNELEDRYVGESHRADEVAKEQEEARLLEEAALRGRAKRRLTLGVGAVAMALVVGVLAVFAFVQRQRADELAATQSRENLARELAAASLASLTSADHDQSLVLAIAAAEQTLAAGDGILPEVVEALHRAVINPRPDLVIPGALGDTDGEAISYSGDGMALAYVTADGAIAIVDPITGSEILRTERVDPPAVGVDFHPDGDRLLSVHPDGIREWDSTDGAMMKWIPHEQVTAASYSRNGELIAIGSDSGMITVHGEEMEIATLDGWHVGRITSVDFDPLGTRLVSAGWDGQALVWDLASEDVTTEFEFTTEFCVYEAAWHPTLDRAVVSLCHGEAFVFDAVSGSRLRAISQANQFHRSMVFDSTGALVAGAGTDGFTRLFSAEVGGSAVVDIPNGGVPVEGIDFSSRDPESIEIATLGLDGEIRIWRDVLAWSELPHQSTFLLYPFIEATPDGRRYVVGANSYILGFLLDCEVLAPVLHVVDAASGEVVADHETFCSFGFVRYPAISDDGSLVAFAGPSGNVVVLQVDEGISKEIPDSARWSFQLDFSSDGSDLAGVGFDGSVAIWDVQSLTRTRVMFPGMKVVPDGQRLLSDPRLVQVRFRPGSHELVTAGADGSVRLWDTTNGTNRILDIFEFELQSMDISPDGSTVVASDISGTMRLLDVDTGEEIRPEPQSVSGGSDVVFSPDGRYLAGGGPGPVVHIWEVESGDLVRRIGEAVGKPNVAFVDDGTEIRAAGAEGMVRGYTLDPLRLLEIARDEVGREMTEDECRRYLRKSCEWAEIPSSVSR